MEVLAISCRFLNESLSNNRQVLRSGCFTPVGQSHLETRVEVFARVTSRYNSQGFVRHSVLSRSNLASTTLLLASLEYLKLEISPSVRFTSKGKGLQKDRFTTSSKSKFVSVIVRRCVNILRVKWSDVFSMFLHESKGSFIKFTNRKSHLTSSYKSSSSSGLSISELELSRSLYSFSTTFK